MLKKISSLAGGGYHVSGSVGDRTESHRKSFDGGSAGGGVETRRKSLDGESAGGRMGTRRKSLDDGRPSRRLGEDKRESIPSISGEQGDQTQPFFLHLLRASLARGS